MSFRYFVTLCLANIKGEDVITYTPSREVPLQYLYLGVVVSLLSELPHCKTEHCSILFDKLYNTSATIHRKNMFTRCCWFKRCYKLNDESTAASKDIFVFVTMQSCIVANVKISVY